MWLVTLYDILETILLQNVYPVSGKLKTCVLQKDEKQHSVTVT